jgi:hypothetical protein
VVSDAPILALGLSVHTGWAACVAAGGDLDRPLVAARVKIELLDDGERFVFHRAAEASAGAAERLVAGARKRAVANAEAALGRLADSLRRSANDLARCAVVAKPGPMPATIAEVVAAHPRIHTAEGVFYRDVLCEAANATGLRVEVVPPKDLERIAAVAMHVTSAQLSSRLAQVGRALGPPWSKDEKLGALAAWITLSGEREATPRRP